jgi:hypothetical protein
MNVWHLHFCSPKGELHERQAGLQKVTALAGSSTLTLAFWQPGPTVQ